MRLAWAFFSRDALIATSYRTTFIAELAGNVLILCVFYFIGQTVGVDEIPALEKYGGNFLAFLLIGIALTDCVGVSMTTFARQIREGQMTGTLEITLMSPVSLPVLLIYSSLWSYFFSTVRLILYLLLGGIIYSVGLEQANLVSGLAIFLLTILSFMGVGILWAAIVLLIKRGEAVMTMAGTVVILVSGVLYPSSVLPGWLQRLSDLSPLTYALDGMRLALLQGYDLSRMGSIVWILCAFSVFLMAAGMAAFSAAVRAARRTGSLAQY